MLISIFVTITNGGAFERERKILVLFVIDITFLMRHTTDIGTELTITYIYGEHARPPFLNDTFFFVPLHPLLLPNDPSRNNDFMLVDLEDKFLFDEPSYRFRVNAIINIDISDIDIFWASKKNC